jgi:diguanylate cyclase (GGDEF)-like protein
LMRANDRLAKLAGTDPLTQVLNRRGIEMVVGREVARMGRTGDQLMAVLIDCDDFKSINDSFGHGVGDAALTALARSVQRTVRTGDEVGRVGGDEFLVLLPSTTTAEGLVVAEKIRGAIKATVLPLGTEGGVRLSASLGVSAVGRDVVSVEEVMSCLKDALSRSKRSGKDMVSGDGAFARPGGGHGSEGPRIDAGAIRLGLVFQEIRSLADDGTIGYEALIRGPPGDFAMPTELFRAAFEENVLTSVDLRALRRSIAAFPRGAGIGRYHVNLFPSTLLNTPIDRVVSILDRSGTTEDRLCVELSEQQFLGDPTCLRPHTRTLQEAGYLIAIDDVGFGRSSVEALMVLDPDVVKVDRRCIEKIAVSPGDRRQLERLLAMLRAVGAAVVVEGVETDQQLRVLLDLGVEYAQGFLFGEPRAPITAVPSSAPRRRSATPRFGDSVLGQS